MNDEQELLNRPAGDLLLHSPISDRRSTFFVPRSSLGSRAGFTLMEVLMVVVIALIAAGMAIPRFASSYKGAKLRTSMRGVVMASRHARATAVLQQKHMAILFDVEQSQFEIVTVGSGAGAAARNQFLEERAMPTFSADDDEGGGEAPRPAVSSEKIRKLAEGVKITNVELESDEQEYDGIYWVNYYPNGMCDKYVIYLADDEVSAHMSVDPLSGTTEVEYEN